MVSEKEVLDKKKAWNSSTYMWYSLTAGTCWYPILLTLLVTTSTRFYYLLRRDYSYHYYCY